MGKRIFLNRSTVYSDIFFCFLNNSFFLKHRYVWVVKNMSGRIFLNIFSKNLFILKFFDESLKFWEFFWSFLNLNNSLVVGFFSQLNLVGLGFRIRKIMYRLYKFWWGRSNFTYLFVPEGLFVQYSYHLRSLYIYSYSSSLVNNFISFFVLMRKLSRYRVYGFVVPNKIIRLYPGKQR